VTDEPKGGDVTPQQLLTELQAIMHERLGDRAGTFKVEAVDEPLSLARQEARRALTVEHREVISVTMVEFKGWIIERDPEARERVAQRGIPPQDIETAVRVAEDAAIALLVPDLSDATRQVLRGRLENVCVETFEERKKASKATFSLDDRHIRAMGAAIVLMAFATLIPGTVGPLVLVGGMVLFVAAFRRWRSKEVSSNIIASHVMKGGVFGRKRNQSL